MAAGGSQFQGLVTGPEQERPPRRKPNFASVDPEGC